jgi:25S rRNA (cytosine2278-C5)-methyltransferase
MTVPTAEKIVYSTCSVHTIENENVVREALSSPEAITSGFALAPRAEVLPTWPRRGESGILDDVDSGDGVVLLYSEYSSENFTEMQFLVATGSVLRCVAGEDATNGFFVACFVRRKTSRDRTKRRATDDNEADDQERMSSKRRKKPRRKRDNTKKPAV